MPWARKRSGEAQRALDLSARGVVLGLAAAAGLSVALRIALASRVPGPFVFLDELGYERLAQSVGETGRLALFGKAGLSYSPLYSVLLAPIYAVGASATAAYEWMRIANAIVISLSVVPIYKIARFVLPRRESIGVAGLSMLAPLMYYSAFVMSENLAFPLCLVALWATMRAQRAPSPRADALLLVSIVLTAAARIQLVVLFPAALTAVALAGVAGRERGRETRTRALVQEVRRHRVLFAGLGLLVAAAALRVLLTNDVYSVLGRYGDVVRSGFPSPWHVLRILAEHVAGLDLAVGVFPFVGALVGGFAFFRLGRPRKYLPFAATAVSVTAWLLVETAFDAAQFDRADFSRIHERYLIYVVPLFLVALFAVTRSLGTKLSARPYLVAGGLATALPAVIPFQSVVNISNIADSFGLLEFGRFTSSGYVAVPHATTLAICIAAGFTATYLVVRSRMRSVVLLIMIFFLLMTAFATNRVQAVAESARTYAPAQRDWVDRARPAGNVILVTGAGMALPWHLTAFNNQSVTRVYSLCRKRFGPEFGEQFVTIDRTGAVRGPSGEVRAPYAVVPARLGVRGRILARNPNGHQVLVAPLGGRVTVAQGRSTLHCD